MPIVTVSRQHGSGGSEVAERVATALGWRLYDNAMVDEVAARLGITSAEVSAREERLPSLSERFASAISLTTPQIMLPAVDPSAHAPDDRIVAVTERVMREAVQAGPAVIVGRGAQCLLAERSDALHVFCYAPIEALVAYVMSHHALEPADARKQVTETNARRQEYVKRHWKREWRDLANYHLCVNTAWLGVDGAAELITSIARARFA